MATLDTINDILTEFEATGEPIYRLLKRKSVPVNAFYKAVKDNAELTERYETARKMWANIRRDTQRETLERKLFDLAHGKAKETKVKTVKHQKDTDGNVTTIETTETTKAPDAKAVIFMLSKLDPFYSEKGITENKEGLVIFDYPFNDPNIPPPPWADEINSVNNQGIPYRK